jgi:hypothetical protein
VISSPVTDGFVSFIEYAQVRSELSRFSPPIFLEGDQRVVDQRGKGVGCDHDAAPIRSDRGEFTVRGPGHPSERGGPRAFGSRSDAP